MYGYSYSYRSARGGSVIFTDKCPMKSREESVFTAWWLPNRHQAIGSNHDGKYRPVSG